MTNEGLDRLFLTSRPFEGSLVFPASPVLAGLYAYISGWLFQIVAYRGITNDTAFKVTGF